MEKWDYFVWYLDASYEAASMTNDLDERGRDGWELVAVVPHRSSVSGENLAAFFKRPAS